MSQLPDIEHLKFPIGKFHTPQKINQTHVDEWIETIRKFPDMVATLTNALSEEQLGWKYRPDGWSIRQLVHHCADSHMNSFIRFKLTMTEDMPTIRPYHEDLWAEMSDYLDMPIASSLSILEGLHARWTRLILDLKPEDWTKLFVHPEHGSQISLGVNIATYAWHCAHHLAHIKQALDAKGKYN